MGHTFQPMTAHLNYGLGSGSESMSGCRVGSTCQNFPPLDVIPELLNSVDIQIINETELWSMISALFSYHNLCNLRFF